MKVKKFTFIRYLCMYPLLILATDQEPSITNEAADIDYSFYRDPYLMQQVEQSASQVTPDLPPEELIASGAEIPTVDLDENRDVDYSYFNDPYAFQTFRKALPVKARLSGYVQHSSWWDSRQNTEFGDGYVLFYPKKRKFDVDCRDINARGEFNMINIETRCRGEFVGPEILGAKSFAYIEADIFGTDFTTLTAIGINRWRIRHAFMELTWPKARVLLGQFWHPIFVVKTFPLTVSFDGGIPTEPFSRNPQVRIIATNNKGTELLLAATSQLAFPSNGPIGFSTTYQRNSRLPDFIVRLSHETEHNYGGFGFTFLRLKPRLESNKGFRVNESINSMDFFAFNTIKFDPLEIRSQLTYGQNSNYLAMIGGFAVSSLNPTTDERKYTNLSSINYWVDINVNRKIEPGLFIGIGKNLGARRNIIQCIFDPATGEDEKTIYGLFDDGDQIDTVFRVSPRVRFHVLPIDFAAEVEYTRAGYGCINNRGRIENVDPVANTRLIFTAYYYF